MNGSQNLEVQDFKGSQNLKVQDFNVRQNLEVQDLHGIQILEVQDLNESQNLEVQDFHGSQNLEVQDFKESENLEFQDFSRSGNHEVKDLNSNQNLEVQDFNGSQNLEDQDFNGSKNLEVQDFSGSKNFEVQDLNGDQNLEIKAILELKTLKTALSSVIMVHCGNTSGSGIVVDAEACLIATCIHVIRDCHNTLIVTEDKTISRYLNSAREVRISQDSSNSTHHKAQVLYATKEDCPLDFALLKVKPNPEFGSLRPRLGPAVTQIKSVVTSKPLFKKGEEIYVVGFPLFASHLNTGASIVSGVISNVAYADNKPVLLQSTAAVHCGASGGALVSMETGELLGMVTRVTSHIKDANLSSSFPHINFSIPANLLYKLVSAVKRRDVEDTLRGLVSDHMKSVWQLKKTVKEKPHITSKL
ncbi:hypothetical protein ACROYT_G036105 [Oculina patagonica]